jgi:hypothetical protein
MPHGVGIAIVQVVSYPFRTVVARVRSWFRPSGICGEKSDPGESFLPVRRFHCKFSSHYLLQIHTNSVENGKLKLKGICKQALEQSDSNAIS